MKKEKYVLRNKPQFVLSRNVIKEPHDGFDPESTKKARLVEAEKDATGMVFISTLN